MKEIGAALVLQTVQGIAAGNLKEQPQSLIWSDDLRLTMLKTAPKISADTCRINWDQPVDRVYNQIRGLSPYPAAFTELEGKNLKIFKTTRHESSKLSDVLAPGEYRTDIKTFLEFACNNGYLSVLELQLEGKKKMGIEDFLRGYHFR